MTSCLLALFFLFSLCASIPPEPPGLKVRVTERGLEVVKDFVIAIFKGLENRPFPPIPIDRHVIKTTITQLTINHLHLDKDKLVLTLDNGSLLIDIKGLSFHVRFQREVNVDSYLFNSRVHSAETNVTEDRADGGLDIKMKLQLKRTKGGRLEVVMPECKAGKPTMKTNSGLGWLIDSVLIFAGYVDVCVSLQDMALKNVNSMLEELPMKLPMVVEELKLAMDYSVSGDITVTPSGLDLPLRGLVYLEGQENFPANTEGADLDLGTDSDKMLYLGISDFFLNSYAASLYKGEAMTKILEKMDNGFLKFWRDIKSLFTKGMIPQKEDINAEIRITEVPIIHIKQDGIYVQPKGQFRASSGKEKSADFQTFSVECDITFKVEVEGENLLAPLKAIKCKFVKGPIKESILLTEYIKAKLEGALKDGVKIPLPPNITFVKGTVTYHEGFMMLAGSLNWTEDAMKTLVETILNGVFP